jgi:hypothetical protein
MERLFFELHVDSLAEIFKAETTGALCVRAHLGFMEPAIRLLPDSSSSSTAYPRIDPIASFNSCDTLIFITTPPRVYVSNTDHSQRRILVLTGHCVKFHTGVVVTNLALTDASIVGLSHCANWVGP